MKLDSTIHTITRHTTKTAAILPNKSWPGTQPLTACPTLHCVQNTIQQTSAQQRTPCECKAHTSLLQDPQASQLRGTTTTSTISLAHTSSRPTLVGPRGCKSLAAAFTFSSSCCPSSLPTVLTIQALGTTASQPTWLQIQQTFLLAHATSGTALVGPRRCEGLGSCRHLVIQLLA